MFSRMANLPPLSDPDLVGPRIAWTQSDERLGTHKLIDTTDSNEFIVVLGNELLHQLDVTGVRWERVAHRCANLGGGPLS